MNNRTITINGKEYPCFRTLAANFDFKDATGKEVTHLDQEAITELVVYMWATIRAACTRTGVDFPYPTARDLAYHLDESDIEQWGKIISGDSPAATSKSKKK